MKKNLLTIGLGGWVLGAVVSLFLYQNIAVGQCFFMSSWPFCQGELSFLQHLVQGLFLGLFFVLISLPFVFFIQKSGYFSKRRWFLFGVLFLFLAAILVPFASSDMLYYLSAGKAVHEGINPYLQEWVIQKPFVFPSGLNLTTGIMYGPIMPVLFSLLYGASLGSFFVFGVLWKLIAIASVICVFLFIKKLIGFLEDSAGKKYIPYLFLFIPLILFEWVGNGHFDGIWIALLLAAVFFAIRKYWMWSFFFLSLGVVIKFLPLIVFPWFLIWWWQETHRENAKKNILQLIGGVALSVGVFILPWMSFWGGIKTLEPLVLQSKWAVSSLFATLYYSLRPFADYLVPQNAHLLTTGLVQGGLLLAALYLAWPYLVAAKRILMKKLVWSWVLYVQAIAATFSVYLLIWQKSFWPWYLSWIIPFLLIVYASRSSRKEVKFLLIVMGSLPLLFYIPWMISSGDATSLPFFWYAQIVCSLPAIAGLVWWRRSRYQLPL